MILEGDPKEMICQAVEQAHVDLLVVGSRGLGMIKRFTTFFILYICENVLVKCVGQKISMQGLSRECE